MNEFFFARTTTTSTTTTTTTNSTAYYIDDYANEIFDKDLNEYEYETIKPTEKIIGIDLDQSIPSDENFIDVDEEAYEVDQIQVEPVTVRIPDLTIDQEVITIEDLDLLDLPEEEVAVNIIEGKAPVFQDSTQDKSQEVQNIIQVNIVFLGTNLSFSPSLSNSIMPFYNFCYKIVVMIKHIFYIYSV